MVNEKRQFFGKLLMILFLGSFACNPEPSITASDLYGTWVSPCINYNGVMGQVDYISTLEINSSTITDTTNRWTYGSNCSAGSVPGSPLTYDVVFGSVVSVTFNGSNVDAIEMDAISNGVTQYSIGYRDYSTMPNRMYRGDTSGTQDGTTSALRPTAVDMTVYWELQ